MRRTVEVGYPRGEETRARILGVAVELFGTKGFDSVSTRDIATASSVPPASLRYYFANKQGLYIACLEHVQALTFKLMEAELAAAEALLADEKVEIERLIESFCALQDARIESMLGGPDGGTAALFTIRHDLPSDGDAGKLAGDSTDARRLGACYIQMMMRISGNKLDWQSALIVTALLNGELTNIFLRRMRLAEIGWYITPERLDWLKRTVRMHTKAILEAYRAE